MTFLGRVELLVCGANNKCCNAGILDDPTQDDFNRGTISTFSGDLLGECNHFDLATTAPNQMNMKLSHHGTDAGKFTQVKVITESRVYQCKFHRFLDNSDTEISHECAYDSYPRQLFKLFMLSCY